MSGKWRVVGTLFLFMIGLIVVGMDHAKADRPDISADEVANAPASSQPNGDGAGQANGQAGGPSLELRVGTQPVRVGGGLASLGYIPDGHISFRRQGSTLSMWVASDNSAYLFKGSALNTMWQEGEGPVLAPRSDWGLEAYTYAAFGSVVADPARRRLIGLYHAEKAANCQPGTFTASIGITFSYDGGKTWGPGTEIITGRDLAPACSKPTGAGQPSALIVREGPTDYIYVYYTDWGKDGGPADAIHLARAPLANADSPSAWKKYYQGRFDSRGTSGQSSPVIERVSETAKYAANASVSFNSALQRYLAVYESEDGFYYSSSRDGKSWDAGPRLLAMSTATQGRISYLSLLSLNEASDSRTGMTGYLLYADGFKAGAHFMMCLPFAITRTSAPDSTLAPCPSPSTEFAMGEEKSLSRQWAWVCSGDISVRQGATLKRLYDDDGTSGLVVSFAQGTTLPINAPYGATCYPSASSDQPRLLAMVMDKVRRTGCVDGNGCQRIILVAIHAGNLSIELPKDGDWALRLPEGWAWACSGDVRIRKPDGTTSVLYDSDALTGLVVGLSEQSTAAVIAEWGGSCQSTTSSRLWTVLNQEAGRLLSAQGCARRCTRVQAIELDAGGYAKQSRWLPR